jgi:SRSO17 transposase
LPRRLLKEGAAVHLKHPRRYKFLEVSEWHAGKAEPTVYWLARCPSSPANAPVSVAKPCWQIELDYQDLRQEFGLDHNKGRG